MGLSNLAEKKTNDKMFGGTDYTPPANYYVALFKSEPTDAGVVVEADYTSYARVEVANNKTTFSISADDGNATIENSIEIRFPTATAGTNAITHFGLFDASTAGNLYAYGVLATPKSYTTGDRPVFEIGALTIKVD